MNQLEALEQYLQEQFSVIKQRCRASKVSMFEACNMNDLDSFLNQEKDLDFKTCLFKFLDEKEISDVECYQRANIDRRLFSKIRSYQDYHPKKETVIALGIAMRLNIYEMEELLHSASYTLPKNNTFDLIIRYCVLNQIDSIDTINTYLEHYHCSLLGNVIQ